MEELDKPKHIILSKRMVPLDSYVSDVGDYHLQFLAGEARVVAQKVK